MVWEKCVAVIGYAIAVGGTELLMCYAVFELVN